MRLFIDGDDSPIKDDAVKLGGSYGLDVVVVTSVDCYTTKEHANHAQIVYVGRGADNAGYKVVGVVKKSDFLITQDHDLASLVLSKDVWVFHHSGKESDEMNIGTFLERYYHSGKLGKAGTRTKGPKLLMDKDYTTFRQALKKTVDRGLPGTGDSR